MSPRELDPEVDSSPKDVDPELDDPLVDPNEVDPSDVEPADVEPVGVDSSDDDPAEVEPPDDDVAVPSRAVPSSDRDEDVTLDVSPTSRSSSTRDRSGDSEDALDVDSPKEDPEELVELVELAYGSSSLEDPKLDVSPAASDESPPRRSASGGRATTCSGGSVRSLMQ